MLDDTENTSNDGTGRMFKLEMTGGTATGIGGNTSKNTRTPGC
jgi:hypothetical protein